MAQDPSGLTSAEASSPVPLSAYLALKAELTERNLARVDLLLKESLEDDDGIPEGLDERTADFLVGMTAKVKSSLLALTEHHNSDISNLLDQLAKEEIKFSLVQAKLSSVLTTVDEYRSENALRTSELNNFKQHFSIIFLIFLFLFNCPDDNLDDIATSHYGDATAPSPNIIFIYEVILVWGFSL